MISSYQADAIRFFAVRSSSTGFSEVGLDATQLDQLFSLVRCGYVVKHAPHRYALTPEAFRALDDYLAHLEARPSPSQEPDHQKADHDALGGRPEKADAVLQRKDFLKRWLPTIIPIVFGFLYVILAWILGAFSPIDLWHRMTSFF